MNREYKRKVKPEDDLYTVKEWLEEIKNKLCCNYDGSGYWVKDGLRSDDEVFSTEPLNATHVAWYNK